LDILSWKFKGVAEASVAVGVELVQFFATSIPVSIEVFREKGSCANGELIKELKDHRETRRCWLDGI